MDIQILNQSEVERQKERKKEAKELEGLLKRSEGTPDDPVRMYLKEMGSVPLLSREEEVEISNRLKKRKCRLNGSSCVFVIRHVKHLDCQLSNSRKRTI